MVVVRFVFLEALMAIPYNCPVSQHPVAALCADGVYRDRCDGKAGVLKCPRRFPFTCEAKTQHGLVYWCAVNPKCFTRRGATLTQPGWCPKTTCEDSRATLLKGVCRGKKIMMNQKNCDDICTAAECCPTTCASQRDVLEARGGVCDGVTILELPVTCQEERCTARECCPRYPHRLAECVPQENWATLTIEAGMHKLGSCLELCEARSAKACQWTTSGECSSTRTLSQFAAESKSTICFAFGRLCPYTESDDDEITCRDGEVMHRIESATCAALHGGLLKCPKNMPHMCKETCAKYPLLKHCCSEEPSCKDHGGPLAISQCPKGICPYSQSSRDFECNDGSICDYQDPDGWHTCCNRQNRGGRRKCPTAFPYMCQRICEGNQCCSSEPDCKDYDGLLPTDRCPAGYRAPSTLATDRPAAAAASSTSTSTSTSAAATVKKKAASAAAVVAAAPLRAAPPGLGGWRAVAVAGITSLSCMAPQQFCPAEECCGVDLREARCSWLPCERAIMCSGYENGVRICAFDQWKCANDECIMGSWRCDEVPDCADGSDEINCVVKDNEL